MTDRDFTACEPGTATTNGLPDLDRRLICAFVQGAKWWEWYKEGVTMWASDRDIAEAQAVFRLEQGTLGLTEQELLDSISQCVKNKIALE